MSKKALIFMTLFSLALIAGSFYIISTLDPGTKAKPSSEVINVIHANIVVSDNFTLQSEDGQKFDYTNLKDKFTLMYFGFSYCPDICPTILQKLSEVANSLDNSLLDKIQFIFVSVDPSRDDLTTLKQFTSQFGDRVLGITGEKEEIDKLTSSLKVYYAQADNTDNYYVDHSSFIYLINPQVKLISQFSSSASVEDISRSINDQINMRE
jgi:protein SCO1